VFLNQKQVLHDINWELRAGQHWAILGPNGAGKTTLLKLICGDVHPAWGGRVQRFGFTTRNTIWEVKQRIGFVSPELQANYRDNMTGAEVIASGFHSSIGLMLKVTRQQHRRVCQLIDWLGLVALGEKAVRTMSYGEFRKILLARALVHDPDILVFDEPFDGLDAPAKAMMANALTAVARKGCSLIVVSHHAEDLPASVTHRAQFVAGRIVEQGCVNPREGEQPYFP
jgi:molybdate transport system ATP-binding protein